MTNCKIKRRNNQLFGIHRFVMCKEKISVFDSFKSYKAKNTGVAMAFNYPWIKGLFIYFHLFIIWHFAFSATIELFDYWIIFFTFCLNRSKRKGFLYYVMGQITQVAKLFYETHLEIEIISEEESMDLTHVVMKLHFPNIAYKWVHLH